MRCLQLWMLVVMVATVAAAETEEDITWNGFLKLVRSEANVVMKRLLPHVIRSLSVANVSQDCERGLMSYALSLNKLKSWALRMADATSKPAAGILDGTALDFGSFDGCLKIRLELSNGEEAFRGRYCMLGIIPRFVRPITQNYIDTYGYPPDWFVEFLNRTGGYWKHAALWNGICLPSTCAEDEILRIASAVAKPLGFDFSSAGCKVDEPSQWTTSSFVAVCILCCIAGICLIGTILDAVQRCLVVKDVCSEPETLFLRSLKSFSLVANTEKLFTVLEGSESLGCFHGIRFFSATWVILGHSYFFTEKWKFLKFRSALAITDDFSQNFWYAIPENFTIPVGAFFFISGFLLVYGMWKSVQNNEGRMDILKFFIHKYWRMTPALGFMIIMFLAMPLIGSGPLWDSTLDPPIQACETRWWTNLLYINNFWNAEEYCLVHTWFLATLMQYHGMGVCLLLLCYRFPIFAKIVGVGLALGTCFITSLAAFHYEFPMPAPVSHITDFDIYVNYLSKVYTKPFCHANSYLIGMAVAFLYLKYKDQEIKRCYQLLGWIIAISGALSALFGMRGSSENMAVNAFYIGFHRIGFAGGLGWMVFACITGRGGIINRILSWKAFAPLGTLSYLAYLMHPLVILYRSASLRERINYGAPEMMFEYLNYTLIAFFLAFVGHVTVEKPFLFLDRIFLGRETLACPKAKQEKETDAAEPYEVKTVKL